MPQLRDKAGLADLARAFATSFSLVEYKGVLYMPVDFRTRDAAPNGLPEHTIWLSLSDKEIIRSANIMSNILFATDAEIRSYKLMLRQFSDSIDEANGILVRIGNDHVEQILEDGTLAPVTGDFVPNFLDVPLSSDESAADDLFQIVSEWVGGDDNAHSLLYHIATALQPTWSAVRYVLLIGTGRNGKSTLLKMVLKLFGSQNISKVKRQDMARQSPILTALNGKLLNIVLDGPKEFLKDSSTEKTLIAGEPLDIELKYENVPFEVRTNALFMEGLQHEPRVSDKSRALQERLVRFNFPNEYALDHTFEAKMLTEENLAAFLRLLLRHWVNKDEVAEKLQLTVDSLDMRMQAVWVMSPILRFLEHVGGRDKEFLNDILSQRMVLDTFMLAYRPWLESNGYKNMEDDYLLQQMNDHFVTDRKSFRINKKPTTKRYIKTVFPDTANAINTLLAGQSLEHATEDQEVLTNE